MASNPQAVMDVLGFFAGNMSKQGHGAQASGIAIDEESDKPASSNLPSLPAKEESGSKDNLKKNVPPPPAVKEMPNATLEAPGAEESTLRDKRRLSTLNDSQLMDALRAIVSKDDPTQIYAKVKNVGQGYVAHKSQRNPNLN